MKVFNDIPRPILWNMFSVFTIGMVCLAVGIAVYVALGDRTMLTMSLMLSLASLLKACNILYMGIRRKYNVITGICTAIRHQAFKRKNEVILVDDEYKELTLYLHRKYKLQEGASYIFYFNNNSIGEQLDINLLGFEKIISH